eukprot:7343467-Lingulodinium_polyedra.AAC.1
MAQSPTARDFYLHYKKAKAAPSAFKPYIDRAVSSEVDMDAFRSCTVLDPRVSKAIAVMTAVQAIQPDVLVARSASHAKRCILKTLCEHQTVLRNLRDSTLLAFPNAAA